MEDKKPCRCYVCTKMVVKEDARWTRYQCPLNPDFEYLGGMGEEPFIRNCKEFDPKYKWLKENEMGEK